MAGDTLRDAFRAKLDAILAANVSITWVQQDTINTGTRPDASAGYFEFEFPGAGEQQFTFGAPGANLHQEQGQVTLRAVAPLNAGKTLRDLAESYLETIRAAFRMARFSAGSRTVQITATGAMGGGQDEAGMWAEAIALSYQVFNVG